MITTTTVAPGVTASSSDYAVGDTIFLARAGEDVTIGSDSVAIAFADGKPYDIACDGPAAAVFAFAGHPMLVLAGADNLDAEDYQRKLDDILMLQLDSLGDEHAK